MFCSAFTCRPFRARDLCFRYSQGVALCYCLLSLQGLNHRNLFRLFLIYNVNIILL
jgi:hypothetical protein